MTVEHDGQGGSGRNDPLLAVVTGEPLSEEARADAALLAEYRQAEADVALLREQLQVIGHALSAEPAPAPAPRAARRTGPERRSGRRPRAVRFALGGLAAAAAASVVVGLGWPAVQSGGGDDAMSGAKAADSALEDPHESRGPLGSPAYLACTRLLAEGTVTDVVPVPGTGRERVTLDVTRSYRPAGGDGRAVTFVKGDEPAFGAPRRLHEGDHVLVAVPVRGPDADLWFVGEEAIAPQRRAIAEALPEARTGPCA
ncbi:hypothetical protein [Streptomyces glaucescens]|uniref:Uncharacterized protein n=1 Tax=Streptomyces glaucescens TaxID=1907 RepID=A0A089X3M3_STRGA|nr:hypothetical protein [Streptomyces glaucescens]AIR98412.1 hypothetical protein SGLAU_12075 [Streptomyces glaucescens]